MNAKIDWCFRALAGLAVTLALGSCNLYSSFSSVGDDEGRIEEALKCLHSGDYACAIAQYEALSDGTEKSRRLCQVYLAQAGLTLSVLITKLGSDTNNSQVLGKVANALVPWDATKQSAAESARTHCTNYKTATGSLDSSSQEFGNALNTLSAVVDCAIRMAKTDQRVATSDLDTACTTAGNQDGKVTAADIADNNDGTITNKGMCASDADACKTAFSAINEADAKNADANLGELINKLPDDLKNGATKAAIRKGLQDSTEI